MIASYYRVEFNSKAATQGITSRYRPILMFDFILWRMYVFCILQKCHQGHPFLWGNDAFRGWFPPVSDFPPYFGKKCQIPWKISPILPFHTKIFNFHPPKVLMTFFSHRLQILNYPPIFAVSVHFLPYFAKFIIFPLLLQVSSDFVKLTCFLHTLCVYRFP